MIARSGFGDDIAGFDAAMKSGDVDGAKAAISDRFLDDLTAIGSAEEVRAGVERYAAAGATSPCVGAVPRTGFEATLEAARPA
jgi:alkanesulfonate monooxygenase SsuD/methylene tetrahydromethanopterin reductase-like flavin-dependent oxidoreductase (luciferase family)